MQTKIYVGNLAYTTTTDELQDYFASCGNVKDVKIPFDRETKRARGFAFVEFETESAAQAALSKNGEQLKGRALKINLAKERT